MRQQPRASLSMLLIAVTTIAWTPSLAQSPPAPAFEVASVKPNRSGAGFTTFGVRPGGRFLATNASVRDLIRLVYQLQDFQIEGAPAWIDTERYDINAKAEGELPALPPDLETAAPPLAFQMVRSLLADRFKLAAHLRTKDAPIYSLVLARTERKPGPQLQAAQVDCAAIRAARGAAPRGGPRLPPPPPPPPPPPGPGQHPACGVSNAPGYLGAGGMALSALTPVLSRVVGRPVVDRTELAGRFDLTLEYMPEQLRQSDMPLPPGAPPPPRADAPSIFSALQEQLGLKLEAQRGPIEFLVIERIERPTEN